MRVALFYGLLLAVVALAFWRGRREERTAATICVAGTLFTALASALAGDRFRQFEPMAFAVDVLVLLSFFAIALRSDRFWPLWVAGLQLTAASVHLLKLLEPALMSFVFRAALAFWSYPILLIIAVAALRTPRIERWRAARQLPAKS
jgi:hypothetical protein